MVDRDRPEFGIFAARRGSHCGSEQLQKVDVRLIVEAIREALDQLREEKGVAGVSCVLKGIRLSRILQLEDVRNN